MVVPFTEFNRRVFFLLTGVKFSHVQNARTAHRSDPMSPSVEGLLERLWEGPRGGIGRWEEAGDIYTLAEG